MLSCFAWMVVVLFLVTNLRMNAMQEYANTANRGGDIVYSVRVSPYPK